VPIEIMFVNRGTECLTRNIKKRKKLNIGAFGLFFVIKLCGRGIRYDASSNVCSVRNRMSNELQWLNMMAALLADLAQLLLLIIRFKPLYEGEAG